MISKKEFMSLPFIDRVKAAFDSARTAIMDTFGDDYDEDTISVEPASYNSDDWHLWIASARRSDPGDGETDIFSAWTLDIVRNDLTGGSYRNTAQQLTRVIAEKKLSGIEIDIHSAKAAVELVECVAEGDGSSEAAIISGNASQNGDPEAPDNTDGGSADNNGGFVLTDDNYYSPQANKLYLSNSMFKAAYGYPAKPYACEAAALLGPKPESEALLVGSYVDAYFEGPKAFKDFKEKNHDRIMQKSGKAPYKFILDADLAIARAERDAVFMDYMDGLHQTVMDGRIGGHAFKIKMDAYRPGERIVDLKYVKSSQEEYNDALKRRATFIENYGYAIQGAIYQEIVYQRTGKRLPFYIAYITKEEVPDFGVVEIPQDKLDEALKYVEMQLKARPFDLIRKAPHRCERRSCKYCRDMKALNGPMSLADFEKYAAS